MNWLTNELLGVSFMQKTRTEPRKRGQHFTYYDRVKLRAYLDLRIPTGQIAKSLNCCPNTVRNEIRRGLCDKMLSDLRIIKSYDPYYAQSQYDIKSSNKGPCLKVGNDHGYVKFVEHMIVNEKYSPDAITGYINENEIAFPGQVSTSTLYRYIDSGDIFVNVSRENLHMQGKRKRIYNKIKRVRVVKSLNRCIDERPPEIASRDEYGHWEMDLVEGKRGGSGQFLLALAVFSGPEIVHRSSPH